MKDLTRNEKEFLFELTRTDPLRPKTNVDAYCNIYRPNSSRRTQVNECSKILSKPHMVKALAEIEAKIEQDRRRASRGNAQAVQVALWKEAREANRSSDRISALKAISAILPKSAFETSVLDGSAVGKAALVARLDELLSSVDETIDVSPQIQEEQTTAAELEILEIESELMKDPDY